MLKYSFKALFQVSVATLVLHFVAKRFAKDVSCIKLLIATVNSWGIFGFTSNPFSLWLMNSEKPPTLVVIIGMSNVAASSKTNGNPSLTDDKTK